MNKTFLLYLSIPVIGWLAWKYMPLLESAPSSAVPLVSVQGRTPARVSAALDPIMWFLFSGTTPSEAVVMGQQPELAALRGEIERIPVSPVTVGQIRASGLRACAILEECLSMTASLGARANENFFLGSTGEYTLNHGAGLIEKHSFFRAANEREWRSKMETLRTPAYRELAIIRELENRLAPVPTPSKTN